MSVLSSFFKSLISPVTNFLGKRSDNKTAIKTRLIERLAASDDKLATWEQIQAEAGSHSWKDEFWTIILSIPAIGCFIPGGAEIMVEGFKALELMPEFYQYWLGVAVLTAFGIRIVKR
jgi:hypothetical protein